MTGFYADIHKKLKLINDLYSHFTKKKKKIKLLFRAVSVKSLVQTKFLVRLNHKLVSFETFSGIFVFSWIPGGVIQISNLRFLRNSSKFCFQQ